MLYAHIGLCEFGWQRTNGALEVVWDTPEAERVVKKQLDFVLSGCGCKTGCNTRRCKCYKQQQGCGPGCRCVGCINPHKLSATQQDDSLEQDKMDENSQEREAMTTQQEQLHHLEVEDMLQSHEDESFVDDDSDSEPVNEDEELDELMDNIFGEGFDGGGSDSDED